MTTLLSLSELTRSFLSLWTLGICLVCLFSIVRSAAQKHPASIAAAVPLLCGSYFLWQVLFDVHLFGGTENAAAVSRALGALPWLVLAALLVAFTAAALANLILVIRYGRRSITPDAVKQCLEQISCGVCCFRDDGLVLFSNDCMNRLCVAVTGERLLDGRELYRAAAGSVLTAEGRRWRFSGRDITLDGERLHELIASDVTAEYVKTEALRQDQEDLSRLKRELKAYTLSIDDTVRRQEILQAKVNIHDEMNRLMLSTMAAEGEDGVAEAPIFALWEQNALLLCMEAENSNTKAARSLEKLAEALRIRLDWDGALPAVLTEAQRSLFFTAAQEAIVNAAKHAEARRAGISFTETEKTVCCDFENDGRLPKGEVRFAGGLQNLSLLAKKQGASLSVRVGGAFTLSLCFLKNPPQNQPCG